MSIVIWCRFTDEAILMTHSEATTMISETSTASKLTLKKFGKKRQLDSVGVYFLSLNVIALPYSVFNSILIVIYAFNA